MVIGIAIRFGAFIAGYLAALVIPQLFGDAGDALGAGLLSFAVAVAAAAVWGFFDGRRRGIGWVAAVWLPVAVLLGVAVPLIISLTGSGFDPQVFARDAVTFVPFVLILVAVPAVLLGLMGWLTNRQRRDEASEA